MAVAAAAAGKLPLLPQDFFQPSESAKLGGTGDKFCDFFCVVVAPICLPYLS